MFWPAWTSTQPMARLLVSSTKTTLLILMGMFAYALLKSLCFSSLSLSLLPSLSLSAGLEPPGPIDNSKIAVMKGGHIQLKQGMDCLCVRQIDWQIDDVCDSSCVSKLCLRVCVCVCVCIQFIIYGLDCRCRLWADIWRNMAVLVKYLWRWARDCSAANNQPPRHWHAWWEEDRGRDQSPLKWWAT